MEWHKYPEEIPSVDVEQESDYLLIACKRATVPLTGYYDGENKEFHVLGCPESEPLEDVRAWAVFPRLPIWIFDGVPYLRKHAELTSLIENL